MRREDAAVMTPHARGYRPRMRTLMIVTLIAACAAPDEVADEYDGEDTPPEEDVPDPQPEPENEAPDPEPAPGAACVEYATAHLQASMQHTDSLADRRAAIDRAFVNGDGIAPDTISWTEIETQGQIDRIQNRAGWATYWPSGSPVVHPANAVPISWRTSVYEFVSGSSVRSSDGLAGVSPNRYVTRVRLRHKASGASVMRVAHHAVSGVDNPQDHVDYRLAAHAKNIASFNARMLGAGFPVIGAGDFNTTRLRALLRDENAGTQPFVFDVPETGGSLGDRLIDYVVRRKSDKNVYVLTGVKFIDLAPSDHRGVRTRYTYRPPPCVP
jgi:hypothetical protein